MKLKVLAISDTHVGEDASLLSFPRGLQHLWDVLRNSFNPSSSKHDEKFEVEEMILLGDIPDRALASTSQIIIHTNALIKTLDNAADIKKWVYIPGNHDHTLWTKYCMSRHHKKSGITPPSGEYIIKGGNRCDDEDNDPWAEDLLSLFFGYPHGGFWRNKKNDFNFVIANPFYAKHIKNRTIEDRTYVFTHGTHFRSDVSSPEWIKKIADYLWIDRFLGGIEIESDCDVTKAGNLEDLENIVAPFVDSLWRSSKDNPTSRSDNFWYMITILRAKLSGIPLDKHQKREPTENSKLFSQGKNELMQASKDNRIWKIEEEDDSIRRWMDHFLPHMRRYINEDDKLKNYIKDDITFVYGDTHHGGWGALPIKTGRPERFRIYNCGGWVMHGDKNYHPACHLFAVDEKGEEYLLDVSFKDENLKVDGVPLLELAARDAENRQNNANRLVRKILQGR